MLKPLFGSVNRERVLIYILARGEAYAREIATYFNVALLGVQRQLERLEAGGVLYSRQAGRTRLYGFNPRYAFLNELKALLEKALAFYSDEEREKLVMARKRPRRKDKPL
jgi:predicted ArsR family transcriptional regulator